MSSMASSAPRKPVGTASSNGYYSNPTQVFNQSSRQFLSSRAGERSFEIDDRDDPRQRRGGGYASPPPNLSSNGYTLPPLVKPNGYPNGYPMSKQQQLAAQMGRSSTAAPRSQPPPDRKGSNGSLYPHHLLQSPPRSSVDAYPSAVAPYSSYDRERPRVTSPSPSYGSSLGSPPSSTASPPPPHPNSPPTYATPLPRQHSSSSHHHRSSHSMGYATEASSNSRLVPQRSSSSSKRNSTGANGSQYPGPGAVGPALAGGIYPVLPKPPSVVGSAQPTPIARRVFHRPRPIIDEDEEASNALNTYR